MPAEHPPDGSQAVPGREETVAGEAASENNMGRPTFRDPTEGRPEGATTRGVTKRLDLREDVKTHWRESFRTPGPTVRAGIQTETWEGGKEESGGRPGMEGGRSRGGGGGAGEGGPAPHT